MALSTGTSAVIGVSFVALLGGGAFLLSLSPAEIEAPERNGRVQADIPERVIPRKEKVKPAPVVHAPPVAEADEVIVISETPIDWTWTHAPEPAAPVKAGEKTQYFGLATPESVSTKQKWVSATPKKTQSATDPGIGSALLWLTEHQHKDGSWRADRYADDSTRRQKAAPSEGSATTDISLTALVLYSMIQAYAALSKQELRAFENGIRYLSGLVDRDGWLEPASPHAVQTQALATLVLLANPLKANVETGKLALKALNSEWIAGSGWPRARRGDTPDATTTALAFYCVHAAGKDNLPGFNASEALAAAAANAAPNSGLWGDAGPDALAAQRFVLGMLSGDKKWAVESIEAAKALRDLPATPTNFQSLWACVLAAFSAEWSEWAQARKAHLLAEQVGFRDSESERSTLPDDKGSWDPDAALATTGGRVAATALAISTLVALNKVPAPKEAAKKDRDRDATPDAAEAPVRPQLCACGPTLYAWRDNQPASLPLQHTDVTAEISGVFAAASLTQTYTNPYSEVIEVVYCFPLPHGAAITDFTLTVGGRSIRGVIRPRAEAELEYSQAIERGQTAALLQRETGNVFNHYVGNIEPGAELEVSLGLFERVKTEDGWHEWVMPLVVGPYYIAGAPVETPQPSDNRVKGHGVEADTSRVPNASRITPPALPEGVLSPNEVTISVELRAGRAISDIESKAHEITVEDVTADHRRVTLARPEKADRDFILRWRTDGDWKTPAFVAHRPDENGDGWFTLMLAPPVEGPADAAREITFIMDISGSMSNQPIECSKRLVTASLDALNPRDKFNVFFFSGGSGQVFQSPVEATADNVSRAKAEVESFRAGGGTEMLAGLQRALEARHDEKYTQTYAFLTDGFVGETDAILRYVQKFGDKVQFFAFGVGYSVNRALIDGIAESANGRAIYYVPDVNAPLDLAPIDAFLGSIRNPVAASPQIDWGKLPVSDVTPGKLGNVYNGQLLAVTGRYSKAGSGKVRVTWLVDGVEQSTEFTLNLPEIESANAALPQVWAAASIHDCELQLLAAPDSPLAMKRLMETSLTHGLSTRWTSFVAVDEFARPGDGKPRTVVQPVEVPKGVDRKQVGR